MIFKQSEKEFVRQQIRYAQIKDHILYLSIGHLTYAESSPHNAYVAAVDLAEKKIAVEKPASCEQRGQFCD